MKRALWGARWYEGFGDGRNRHHYLIGVLLFSKCRRSSAGSVVALVPAAQVVGVDVAPRGTAAVGAFLEVGVVVTRGFAVAAVELAGIVVVEVERCPGGKRGIRECGKRVHG